MDTAIDHILIVNLNVNLSVEYLLLLARARHPDSLKPFLSLLHLKLDWFPLLERLVSFSLNRLEVDEEVLPTFTRDESVPLRIVEPLDGALFHGGATLGCGTWM